MIDREIDTASVLQEIERVATCEKIGICVPVGHKQLTPDDEKERDAQGTTEKAD